MACFWEDAVDASGQHASITAVEGESNLTPEQYRINKAFEDFLCREPDAGFRSITRSIPKQEPKLRHPLDPDAQDDHISWAGNTEDDSLETQPSALDLERYLAEPDEPEGDFNESRTRLENFSTLDAELREIEVEHVGVVDEELQGAHDTLMVALGQYRNSRFHLGQALAMYKKQLAEKKKQSAEDCGWMAAAKSIAEAMSCDERTVRNILADYERTAGLPGSVIQAAKSKGIDLAQRRYRPAVAAIESIIENESNGQDDIDDDDAERIVSNVLVMPPPKQQAHVTDDSLINLTPAEKQHFAVRMKIRTALTNVELDQKLSVLMAALEEEMFSIWDQREPVTVTIRPHASAYTIDGRKKREDIA